MAKPKKASKSKPQIHLIPKPPAATKAPPTDEWVEPGEGTNRFDWQQYAEMEVGEERDAPEGANWTQVRSSIRQLVLRTGKDKLRLVMKQVADGEGQPTGGIIIKRLQPAA